MCQHELTWFFCHRCMGTVRDCKLCHSCEEYFGIDGDDDCGGSEDCEDCQEEYDDDTD